MPLLDPRRFDLRKVLSALISVLKVKWNCMGKSWKLITQSLKSSGKYILLSYFVIGLTYKYKNTLSFLKCAFIVKKKAFVCFVSGDNIV